MPLIVGHHTNQWLDQMIRLVTRHLTQRRRDRETGSRSRLGILWPSFDNTNVYSKKSAAGAAHFKRFAHLKI